MRGLRRVIIAGVVVSLAAACSGSGKSAKKRDSSSTSSTTTAVDRPAGPAADLSTELTGGKGVFMGTAIPVDVKAAGYVEEEYAASGTATSYKAQGVQGFDGRWVFAPDTTAAYRTRVLVRRPKKASDFSGTVAVEWLNVSGGVDADPDWATLHEELLRRGDAWVGVSAQAIGVNGGPVAVTAPGGQGIAGVGLKKLDPARYGSLEHPGDAFSYDIYTQVARAVRNGDGLENLRPHRVIAVGESQSAIALVTYVNGVQPLTKAFDGFFVHSRGGTGLPLVGPGQAADIAAAITTAKPTIFRTDTDVPIMDVQTESDLTGILDSVAAHQPDTGRFRLWEVPGTAHADKHLLGNNANAIDCGAPINNGPLHVVAKAAYHDLAAWVETGTAPPSAARIEITDSPKPVIVRDADGIARGGIRTPPVDVPVDALSGAPGPNPSTLCILLGSTKPLPDARIAQLYRSRSDYQRRYDDDADRVIAAGFALRADRDALLAFAQPSRVPAV